MISQLTKDKGNERVLRWIEQQDEDDLFLSVATLLEIRVGVELCAAGQKREELERWLVHDLLDRFEDRIVPIERHTADLTGRIIARSTREGWKMEPMGCRDRSDGDGARYDSGYAEPKAFREAGCRVGGVLAVTMACVHAANREAAMDGRPLLRFGCVMLWLRDA